MELQCQLDDAVAIQCRRYLAAGRRVDQCPRKREDGVVRDIEEFRTEFQPSGLGEHEVFEQREICLEQVVSAENVAAAVAVGKLGGNGECIGYVRVQSFACGVG